MGRFKKKKHQRLDVLALIQGRAINPNRSLTALIEQNKKITREQVMIDLGIWAEPVNINRREFRKNRYEKAMLKKAKLNWKKEHPNHSLTVIIPFNAMK